MLYPSKYDLAILMPNALIDSVLYNTQRVNNYIHKYIMFYPSKYDLAVLMPNALIYSALYNTQRVTKLHYKYI